MVEGVDYSRSVPDPAALKVAGKKFVVRYGGPGSLDKQLTGNELAALRANGIDVVANAEGSSGGFSSRANGILWAQSALAFFTKLGMPGNRPIYFSVDWDAKTTVDFNGIDFALGGAASVLGPERVGVYGGYDVISHCFRMKTARWFWQTYAWSESRWHPAAHIRQYQNGVKLGGGLVDLDRAMTDDYGQWGYEPMGVRPMITVDGSLPTLHEGDKDPVTSSGAKYVERAQRVLGMWGTVTPDGWYGPKTAAAVKTMMAGDPRRSTGDGTVIGESEWRRLYALWG